VPEPLAEGLFPYRVLRVLRAFVAMEPVYTPEIEALQT